MSKCDQVAGDSISDWIVAEWVIVQSRDSPDS